MVLVLELALLFVVIFFAVRLATTGHVDKQKLSEPPPQEIAQYEAQPVG